MNEQRVKSALADLLTHLGLPWSDITVSMEKDLLRLDIISDTPSRIIGWHGETLNAVQHILKSIVRTQEKLSRAPFLLIDVDGYRREQEDKVKRIADQKADFVRRTGSRVALSPMSPYFRRIVHLYVADHPQMQDLVTDSIGEGDYRQIVLKLKDEKGRKSGEELSPVMAGSDGLENLDI